MATCKNCGKPLILQGGRCIYCLSPEGSSQQVKWQPRVCDNGQGQQTLGNNERKHKWVRILLLTIVILVSVLLGIAELHTDNGLWWGFASVCSINGCAIFSSVIATYWANRGGFIDSPKSFRLYYEWIHYFVEIVLVAVGYIVLLIFEETWILLINLFNGYFPIRGAMFFEKSIFGKDSWPKE